MSRNPDGILSFNPEGCLINWNPSMEFITGLHRREVLGRHWSTIMPWLEEQGIEEFGRRYPKHTSRFDVP
jgi:PAS domain S-box-containing protein